MQDWTEVSTIIHAEIRLYEIKGVIDLTRNYSTMNTVRKLYDDLHVRLRDTGFDVCDFYCSIGLNMNSTAVIIGAFADFLLCLIRLGLALDYVPIYTLIIEKRSVRLQNKENKQTFKNVMAYYAGYGFYRFALSFVTFVLGQEACFS